MFPHRSHRLASADCVRHRIASAWLAGERSVDAERHLGSITLRAHQVEAVQRVLRSFDEFGGALLADEVGLGKTYVALAVARAARSAIIVAPAALRRMWRDAQAAAATAIPFVSVERLSRSAPSPAAVGARNDLVIVDEAHHARNPRTRRYAALARMTVGARVLLLTATPLHNRRRDLEALLALFLGERASTLDDASLARCVVRRDRSAVAGQRASPPEVTPTVSLALPPEDDLLDAILALPPPLPTADAGDGGVLVMQSLVRQWSSSRAALRAALRRRVVRAEAMLAALAQGRLPTTAELRAWIAGDDAVQLGLDLFAPALRADEALSAVLSHHLTAVRTLLRRIQRHGGDAHRAELLRRIRREHAGLPVVAFSHSAETVRALWTLLAPDGGVCALESAGARVAGGRMSREEALDRFAPVARGRPPPPAAERVTCLLATDLLSEGVNLQDAGVVVHLDLPWTPARLEQRVGRVARTGALHAVVHVYAIEPPASAAAKLRLHALLERKRALTAATIGGPPRALPSSDRQSGVAASELLRSVLARWLAARCGDDSGDGATLIAAVASRSGSPAALAAVRIDGREFVVAVDVSSRTVTTEPQALLARAGDAGNADVPVDPALFRSTERIVRRWLAHRAARDSLGIMARGSSRVVRELLRTVAALVARVPRHERSAAMADAERIRRAARGRLGAGMVTHVEELLREDPRDRAWFARVVEVLAADGTVRDCAKPGVHSDSDLLALLLLQCD